MIPGIFQLIRHRQAVLWTLVTGLGLTGALGWELNREALELDRQRLARRVVEIQSQLDARMEKSEMLLNNLRDFLRLSGENRDSILDRWCYDNGLTINCRWIHGIVVATNRHTSPWRNQFPNPPGEWSDDDWERLKEVMVKQPIDCEIAFQSNITNTTRYLKDYHLRSFGHAKEQFAVAVKNSRLQMSERRYIMSDADTNGIIGTVFYVPIYSMDLTSLLAEADSVRPTKWSQRAALQWLNFRSMIVAPVNFDALLDALHSDAPADVEVELFSSTNQTVKTWLGNSARTPKAIDPDFNPYLSHSQRWLMYGNKFSIFFYTTPLFEAQSPRRLATVSMGAGTILTLMATTLVGVALRSRDRQEVLTDQIREARDALAAAQKAREQFSRDLHDGTIQSLYAIQLGLGHLVGKLEDGPADTRKQFATVRKELDAVIAEIRNFINAGEVADTHAVNLTSVLAAVVQRAQAGASARITLQCDKEAASQLSAADAVQLANIAREAISNSLRHAKPAHVDVSLSIQDKALVLVVRDDGTGFDPDSPQRFGVGLNSMRTRAVEIGGSFSMASSPGGGTRIQISIPTHQDANT